MALHKKRLKWALGLSGLVAVAAVLVYMIFVPTPVQVEVATVTRGSFVETIRTDGVLRSKERYTVTAFADGDLRRMPLKVGDTVKKGERLTELFWDVRDQPVKAPIDGVISKVYRDSAGPVRRGDPIVEIIDPKQLEVMAELLTTEAIRLRPGAEVVVEGSSEQPVLKAQVIRVSKAGFTKPSALGVEEERTEVTADLVSPPADLIQQVGSTYHVDVTFKVSQRENVLKVPVGALFREGSHWAVYLSENGRARKKPIEVGALGSDEAWIRSGLAQGDEVLVYPGDLVKDGQRIRQGTLRK